VKFVVQRVSRAQVSVDNEVVASIEHGLLVLVGFHRDDQEADCEKLLDKLLNLRIFNDEAGKMNHSVSDVGGAVLFVPQFTLYADTSKGKRPSFIAAARPERGSELFEHLLSLARTTEVPVECGVFQASMEVELVNEGPVTIVMQL